MSAANANASHAVLLGMGNPLLDISADVPDSVLEKYGVVPGNAILAEDKHLPVYDELVKEYNPSYIAGGATQNSIRVAQWMLQQPGATAFIGCVGKDKYADQLRSSATADGVNVPYMVDETTPTGTCACLINKDDRSLIANLSAANNYKVDHLLSDPIKPVWENAKVYYISGFFLTVSPESVMHIGKHVADTDKVFCLNLAAPFICQFFDKPLMDAIPYVDIIFGNESECQAFGEKQGYEEKTVEDIAKRMSTLPSKRKRPMRVIITQGSKSTLVAENGQATSYAVAPMKKEDIVDVNGAGDAFVGGFLSQLVAGKDTKTCVEAGHYSASCILKVSGTELKGKPAFGQ